MTHKDSLFQFSIAPLYPTIPSHQLYIIPSFDDFYIFNLGWLPGWPRPAQFKTFDSINWDCCKGQQSSPMTFGLLATRPREKTL